MQLPLCRGCISDLPLLGQACKCCALPISSGEICGACLKKPPLQTRSFSLYRYQDTARTCITAFKFDQKLMLARLFSQMMAEQLSHRTGLPEYLIPVPLHPRRIRSRGYNQAAILSQQLAKQLGLRSDLISLQRIRNTVPQSSLSYKAKKRNLKQAFEWQSHRIPTHVAVVDDVMTSGSTAEETAKTLKNAGVKDIEIWTIARAIGHY